MILRARLQLRKILNFPYTQYHVIIRGSTAKNDVGTLIFLNTKESIIDSIQWHEEKLFLFKIITVIKNS